MTDETTENTNGAATNGVNRDSTGRFQRGHRLGGRSRGIDLRALAEEFAAKEGLDLPRALWGVCKRMLALAIGGDVQAARLMLERLTDTDETTLRAVAVLRVITGVDADAAELGLPPSRLPPPAAAPVIAALPPPPQPPSSPAPPPDDDEPEPTPPPPDERVHYSTELPAPGRRDDDASPFARLRRR